MKEKWCSLHNHTPYSKLDSMFHINEGLQLAKSFGMKGIAITDHGNISGFIKFYNAAKDIGINPIFGCEMYITEDRLIKKREIMKENNYHVYHLILYAKNNEGYENLIRICSDGATNGYFDGRERTDINFIKENNLGKNIIATSACIGGPIAACLTGQKKERNIEEAKKWALELNDLFDKFYIELQCTTDEPQVIVNNDLINIAKETNLPLIIQGDTHYVKKEDAPAHDILLCTNTKKYIDTEDRFKFPSDQYYLHNHDEVLEYCKTYNIPLSAMQATVDIVDACIINPVNPLPIDDTELIPSFDVPELYTEDTFLREKVFEGLYNKCLDCDMEEYINRITYELSIISAKKYSGYFLILWDIMQFCIENDIFTGPGRGSAAGSLVSYLLGITKLDPIVHGLMFERFLNPEKTAFPDIDSDFQDDRREEVIQYIINKYGKSQVCQIIGFGHQKLRSVVRDVMRTYHYSMEEMNNVVNCIPSKLPDQTDPTFKKMKDLIDKPEESEKKWKKKYPELLSAAQLFFDNLSILPDIIQYAIERLEGCIRTHTVHAAGVIICPKGKQGIKIPVRKMANNDLLVSQFDMDAIDIIKALKLDILGLKTLSVLDIACDYANISNKELDRSDYNLHPGLWKMLRDGLTKQIFQLASPGITKMIQQMNISSFEELIAAAAMYRPGPLTAIDEKTGRTMVESYIYNKANNSISSIHKDLDEILAPTMGCMIYQEQLIAVACKIAGYTLGKADIDIRKPVGKKKIDMFPTIRKNFVFGNKEIGIPGAIKNGYSEDFGNSIFDMILCFGGYGFNKSHSACYADIGFKTAYMKFYYPHEFMAAAMTVYASEHDEIMGCIQECRKMGIKLIPPDINESDSEFSVTEINGEKVIKYGFTAIKGIAKAAVDWIKKLRPYTSFKDFYDRVHDESIRPIQKNGRKKTCPLSKRNEPILIYIGAFDSIEPDRHKLLREYKEIRKDKEELQLGIYDKKHKLAYEKEYIGLYLSDHPLKNLPFERYNELFDGDTIKITGIVLEVQLKTGKNNYKYAKAKIETLEDKRNLLIGRSAYKYIKLIKKNKILIFTGKKNEQYHNIQVNKVEEVELDDE